MRDARPSATTWLGASVRCGLLAAGLLLAAGCDLTGQSTNAGGTTAVGTGPVPVVADADPLKNSQLPPTGLTPLPPPNRTAAEATPQPRPAGTGAVPPITQSTGTPSTAALASGKMPANPQPADGRDLRIDGGPAVPPGTAPTQQSAWENPPRGSGLALTSGAGNADGFTALETQLQQRNVVGQRFEQIGQGQWEFRCTVQNPTNPNLGALYKAQAPDLLAAMRSAIDQIDEDRSKPTTPPATPSGPPHQ